MADVGISTAKGILGGAGTGAAIGSTILPGAGTGVGAILGAVVGGISGHEKASNINKAMAAFDAIPGVDPNMISFKDTLLREKKAVESGFTTDFQMARDMIAESEAGGMSVAAEMARINPAMALMTMTQVGRGTDDSVNKALGTISTRSVGYTGMIADLTEKISMREMQIAIAKASQKMGLATKEMSDFNSNMNAGMLQLGGALGGMNFPERAGTPGVANVVNPGASGNIDPAAIFSLMGIGIPNK